MSYWDFLELFSWNVSQIASEPGHVLAMAHILSIYRKDQVQLFE